MLGRAYLFVVGLTICITGCSGGGNAQSQAMLNEKLDCPEGSKGEYDRWGGIDSPGWAHSCKMNHGKYHVWNGDVLMIEGLYDHGKKEGVWIFRDEDGNTTKTVEYSNGVEIKK